MARPWTAKPKRETIAGSGPPSLLELCTDAIAQHLHTIPFVGEVLPHHILKEVLDRRKNQNMTDTDVPLLLSTTFEVVPPTQVDYLSFKNCHKVTSDGIKVVFDNCPALTSLDLSFCELIGDDALKGLSQRCPGLRELDLTGCRLVTDEGCKHLGILKHLAGLRLELCNKVTDMGVQAVVRGTGPSLRELNVGDVRQMTNISVQIIADHCTNLTSLSIAGNMQATDMDVADVCKKCLGMQSLNLRACRRLTDGCLKPISAMLRGQHRRGIPALRALDLGGCGRLTDDALCNMLPLCSSLTLLDLRGCRNLTQRSRDLVDKYCPHMSELTFPKLDPPTQ
uniref:F-box/LRR-repeat protein 15-like leucin rich repeat domain-containing protein n=2 Tax=Hemiselmis andersenii TaxID=464988 RepID=A0A7S1GSM5_HEMAN